MADAAPPASGSASEFSYSAKFKLPDHYYGGNSIDIAVPSKVKDFVVNNDGHTVITKVRCPSFFPLSPPP